MRVIDKIQCDVEFESVCRELHLPPDSEQAAELQPLVERAAGVLHPRTIWTMAFIEERAEDTVLLRTEDRPAVEATFTSRVLSANLGNVERVFPYVATCGPEVDELPVPADDFLGRFCLDAVKAIGLKAARSTFLGRIKTAFKMEKVGSMNPGSGDQNVWPIEQQKELFSLFGDVEKLIGVRLTDSCLMIPNKSVSGLLYPTETDFVTCQLCHREGCSNRKAPFDEHLWEENFG